MSSSLVPRLSPTKKKVRQQKSFAENSMLPVLSQYYSTQVIVTAFLQVSDNCMSQAERRIHTQFDRQSHTIVTFHQIYCNIRKVIQYHVMMTDKTT